MCIPLTAPTEATRLSDGVSRIILSLKELDYISREFGLPYIRRSQPGLLYLLKCSRYNKRVLVNEFLVNDDSRVLEVTSVGEVADCLFPGRVCTNVVVLDCPNILLELSKKEEWNTHVRKERLTKRDYPLTSCAVHNCIQMLEILLRSELKFDGRRSLEIALKNESLKMVNILLHRMTRSSASRDWLSSIHFAVDCKKIATFRLFLAKIKLVETFPWSHLLDCVVKKSKTELFRLLCDNVRVVAKLDNYSTLKNAVIAGSVDIVKIILANTARMTRSSAAKDGTSLENCDKAFDLAFSLENFELLNFFVLSGKVSVEKLRQYITILEENRKVRLYSNIQNILYK